MTCDPEQLKTDVVDPSRPVVLGAAHIPSSQRSASALRFINSVSELFAVTEPGTNVLDLSQVTLCDLARRIRTGLDDPTRINRIADHLTYVELTAAVARYTDLPAESLSLATGLTKSVRPGRQGQLWKELQASFPALRFERAESPAIPRKLIVPGAILATLALFIALAQVLERIRPGDSLPTSARITVTVAALASLFAVMGGLILTGRYLERRFSPVRLPACCATLGTLVMKIGPVQKNLSWEQLMVRKRQGEDAWTEKQIERELVYLMSRELGCESEEVSTSRAILELLHS